MNAGATYDACVIVLGGADFVGSELRSRLAGLARVRECDTPPELTAADVVDLVLVEATPERLAFVEQVQREHPTAELLVVASEEIVSRAGELLRSSSAQWVPPSEDLDALEHRIGQILMRRALARENRHMRAMLRTVEECRSLIGCLDAGKVYSLTLDLLLNTLSRTRGLSVFHRSAIPLADALVFRGLSEVESRRLREILTDEKPLALESFREIEEVDRGPVHEALREVELEAGTLLAVPLAGDDDENGVVWIFEDGRGFDAGELERVHVVADYAKAALRNCERYGHAKERAFIDDVTEVYNARYLLSAAENEIRRAERYETPLSVLFLDLDRFKLVNDRFGHLVGSQTLRKLSQLLLQCVRQVDTLARYGGDEFTILLVDTAGPEALAIARRIRQTVEGHVFEAGRDATLRVTISIGVATYPGDGATRDQLLDAADKAMYRAKSQGRNRVCTADDL